MTKTHTGKHKIKAKASSKTQHNGHAQLKQMHNEQMTATGGPHHALQVTSML
jgi:hypothetical protein